MKSKGSIDMSEVMSIQVLMNQAGNYSNINIYYDCNLSLQHIHHLPLKLVKKVTSSR